MSKLETTLKTTLDVLTSFYYSVGGKEEQNQAKEEAKKEDKLKDSSDFKMSLVLFNEKGPNFEALEDSLKDLLGYTLLTLNFYEYK